MRFNRNKGHGTIPHYVLSKKSNRPRDLTHDASGRHHRHRSSVLDMYVVCADTRHFSWFERVDMTAAEVCVTAIEHTFSAPKILWSGGIYVGGGTVRTPGIQCLPKSWRYVFYSLAPVSPSSGTWQLNVSIILFIHEDRWSSNVAEKRIIKG